MDDGPKMIDPDEFRSEGYLHEINRRFLHPLGLALAVEYDDAGAASFAGAYDYRDDPEGVRFETVQVDLVENVDRLTRERHSARMAALGYWVQQP